MLNFTGNSNVTLVVLLGIVYIKLYKIKYVITPLQIP